MSTASATAFTVSVDRVTKNARGRAATIFVYTPADATSDQVRATAEAHLLPGEHLQCEGVGRSGFADEPRRYEYAVFA